MRLLSPIFNYIRFSVSFHCRRYSWTQPSSYIRPGPSLFWSIRLQICFKPPFYLVAGLLGLLDPLRGSHIVVKCPLRLQVYMFCSSLFHFLCCNVVMLRRSLYGLEVQFPVFFPPHFLCANCDNVYLQLGDYPRLGSVW